LQITSNQRLLASLVRIWTSADLREVSITLGGCALNGVGKRYPADLTMNTEDR